MALPTTADWLEYLELPKSVIDGIQSKEASTYSANANQFLSALVNKILYQTVDGYDFKNPFAKFDSFDIEYGDTIENVWVEPVEGYDYDPDNTNPFGQAKPGVTVMYAQINSERQYKVTINDAYLRRAVLSAAGITRLVGEILSQLPKAADRDNYFLTMACLQNEDIYYDGFEEVEKADTAEETAKKVTETIIDAVSGFESLNTVFNAAGVLNPTPKSDALLIIKRTVYNSINLDYLTGVFNLEKVDLIKNIIVLDDLRYVQLTPGVAPSPDVTSVEGEDLDFIVLDSRGFDNHMALQDGGLIYNPQGKYTNHFYNVWRITAFRHNYNARAFKLVEPSAETSEAAGN